MNLSNFLRNPIVVVCLCVAAGVFVYLNVVRPLQKSGNGTNNSPVEQIAEEEVAADTVAQGARRTEGGVPLVLREMGWQRRSSRDPFRNAPLTDGTIDVKTTPELSSIHNVGRSTQPLKKTLAVRQPLLRAISIGPQGRVALLGSIEVREGDYFVAEKILRIYADSILLQKPDGTIRKLDFKTSY